MELLLDAEHAFIKISFLLLLVSFAFLELFRIAETLNQTIRDEVNHLLKLLPPEFRFPVKGKVRKLLLDVKQPFRCHLEVFTELSTQTEFYTQSSEFLVLF